MPNRDDEQFRIRPAPPKARGNVPRSKFVSRIIKQASRGGRAIGKSFGSSRESKAKKNFGRGQVAAKLAGRSLNGRSRRVVIQTHTLRLQKASPRSTELHLRYIARDAATRNGEPGKLFGATTDEADAGQFVERSQSDRHNFRIMISPEDGAELGDLKAFTRDLMSQVERDLGTRLEWVAAEHWDTDQPHFHITLRGKDESGRDLVIAPDYIAHGMRARAAELATEWLGPRTDLEIRKSLQREVTQERWTGLDRSIAAQAVEDRIVIRDDSSTAEARFRTGLLIGRLDHLTGLGIASKSAPYTYQLAPNAESTLRTLGERGDIIRTMQRAMGGERREFVLTDDMQTGQRVIGRIAGKGLADELTDQGYLVVDGIDGRAHYVKLTTHQSLEDFPTGGIVEVSTASASSRADLNIRKMTENGIYQVERHRQAAFEQLPLNTDLDAFVQSHIRRLEALRRANIVERLDEGHWAIPSDFESRARAYDAERKKGGVVELRSALPLHEQITAMGATWLDHQLVGKAEPLATRGFGSDTRIALARRAGVLVERGLAERRGTQVILARNLLDTLRKQDLDNAAHGIETETGLRYRPATDGRRISGTYRRSITLSSGRFAMLDDATGFSLVPWRPVIEKHLGQTMSALVRGNFTSFDFGRTRDLTL